MYAPREDSFLLLKHVKIYAHGNVLDMGTGSSILALEAAKYADKVIACDIDDDAIANLKKEIHNKKVTFTISNLFSKIDCKFDLIVFNPPYLPSKNIKYRDIDGGKDGTQVIAKFLKQAKTYLKKEGKILLLTSSLNKGIEDIFKRYKYQFKKIDQESLFFEKLYVYELS
jgi:release factor glutamine methyltransferase